MWVLWFGVQVGTGKTSLVRQYVHKTFSNNYKSTIGEIRSYSLPCPYRCPGPVQAAQVGCAAQVWTLR